MNYMQLTRSPSNAVNKQQNTTFTEFKLWLCRKYRYDYEELILIMMALIYLPSNDGFDMFVLSLFKKIYNYY